MNEPRVVFRFSQINVRSTTRTAVLALALATTSATQVVSQCELLQPIDFSDAFLHTTRGTHVGFAGSWCATSDGQRTVTILHGSRGSFAPRQSFELEDGAAAVSLSLSNDVLAVGFRGPGNTAGVRVLHRDGDEWTDGGILTPWDDPDEEMGFGDHVVVNSDILVVAHPLDTVLGMRQAGSLYVFRRIGNQWLSESKIQNPEPLHEARFGRNCEMGGDSIIALASVSPTNLPTHPGGSQLYVFRNTGSSWRLAQRVKNSWPEARFDFTGALALDGRWMAVSGRPLGAADSPRADDEDGPDEHSVYIYRRIELGWRFFQEITLDDVDIRFDPERRVMPQLGLDGTRLAVPGVAVAGGQQRPVHIVAFQLDDEFWRESSRTVLEANADEDADGVASIVVKGNVAIVGSPHESRSEAGQGGLYSWDLAVPPTAVVDSAEGRSVELGLGVRFDATSSTTGEADTIATIEWNFGDGATAFGWIAEHTYAKPGRYTVETVVTDSAGLCGAATTLVDVSCRTDIPALWGTSDPPGAAIPGASRFGDPAIDEIDICAPLAVGAPADPTASHLASRRFFGNLVTTARVEHSERPFPGSHAGIVVAATSSLSGPFAALVFENAGGSPDARDQAVFFWRPERGAPVERMEGPEVTVSETWFELRREGNDVFAHVSNDGINWLQVSNSSVQLPRSVRVGVAAAGVETGPHGELLVYRARIADHAVRGLTESFLRGDINSDGRVEVSDSVRLFNFLFRAGPLTDCRLSADVNGNNRIDLSDGIYGLNFLFMGGPTPPIPFPDCGVIDMVDGTLTCESSEICR